MPLVPLRNALAFPAGIRPSLNLNHIALSGGSQCRFAGVARNGNFADLTRGVSGTITSTPTRVIDGTIGDSLQGTAATGVSFTGRATTDPKMTFGAIVRWSNFAASSFSFIFANSTNTTGYNGFLSDNAGNLNIRYAAANYNTSAIVANNIPYFVAGSCGPNAPINFVVTRLDTGRIVPLLAGPTTSYSDTPNGTYVVGNWPSLGTFGLVGRIAAVAYTNAYLTMAQMLEWAQAPWDFWYPPMASSLITATVAKAAPVVSASQARVMVLA